MVSLLVGGVIAWVIVMQGGPEALGAIIPLMLVGAVHLFIGPLAVFHAFTHSNKHSLFIYVYFTLFLVAAIWLMDLEGAVFYAMYVTFMIVPLLLVTIGAFFKQQK
jgi:hypothetical protein